MRIFIIEIIILFLLINPISARTINVKDFGAKGNGISDDTKAIQTAIDDASSNSLVTIYFPAGIYNIGSYSITNNFLENYCIKLHSNLNFSGDGNTSIILLADHIFDKRDSAANGHIFYGSIVKNISFSNLMIDMNGGNNLAPLNVFKNYSAIFCSIGENYHIKNITIKNCSGTNMIDIMSQGNNLIIENCRFINGGNYVGILKPNKDQIDFSFIYSEWTNTIVRNNFIQQQNIEIALANYSGGIELHGSNSSALGNYIEGCWPGIYITSSRGVLENITVQQNKILNCVTGIFFYINDTIKKVLIKNNTIHLTHARSAKNDLCVGIRVPNGNGKEYSKSLANIAPIFDLMITGNTIDADSMQILSMGMLLHSLHKSEILGNVVKKMNYGGIVLQGSKWGTDSLIIQNNSFLEFRPNYHPTAVAGYLIITDTYSPGEISAPGFKNVNFRNNKLIGVLTKKANAPPKRNFFGGFIALPSKMVGEIKFKNNKFTLPSENIHIIETDGTHVNQ